MAAGASGATPNSPATAGAIGKADPRGDKYKWIALS